MSAGEAGATPSTRTLAGALSGRDNAFGFLRLLLALLVIFDHAYPLGGFGENPMARWSQQQESFGGIAVGGFFAISGYLIAKSSVSTGWLQFLWRRALRIFPGYWLALLVGALVVGPIAWTLERNELSDYFTRSSVGPLAYLIENAFLSIGRYCIYDIFETTTPYGLQTHQSVLNGSLWTLIYEWHCYLLVLGLSLLGLLRRARIVVPIAALVLLAIVSVQLVDNEFFTRFVPLLADIYRVRFTCLFLFGSTAALYAEALPIDDRLGIAALIAWAASLHWGGYFLIGYPALVYLLLWLAVRLPPRLRTIGSKSDYSYGIYLYGFLVQQLLAERGAPQLGLAAYVALSMLLAFACAFLSWHLVEKRAMRLKGGGSTQSVTASPAG